MLSTQPEKSNKMSEVILSAGEKRRSSLPLKMKPQLQLKDQSLKDQVVVFIFTEELKWKPKSLAVWLCDLFSLD